MAAIHDLIGQIGDERLRERSWAEWACATRERKFGLVFENPSRDEHVDKARSPARFAERHGALFGLIQIIRKRKVAGAPSTSCAWKSTTWKRCSSYWL